MIECVVCKREVEGFAIDEKGNRVCHTEDRDCFRRVQWAIAFPEDKDWE